MSISLIPETAPFSEEQRAWLNGFLAGWVGLLDDDSVDMATSVVPGLAPSLPDSIETVAEEDFPWHDPNLEIEERLKLAEGKPLERRMMAAMAQLNCGACGYVCKTYSEAIATGNEKNLTLCSPGGKETAKMLKQLTKERSNGNDAAATSAPTNGKASLNGSANGSANGHHNGSLNGSANGYSRQRPYTAKVKRLENLNREGSAKVTTHVVIDIDDKAVPYKVGDSLGVYPTNCPDLVDSILEKIGHSENQGLRRRLQNEYCLRGVSDELLELLAANCQCDERRGALLALVDSDELDSMDVLDVVNLSDGAMLDADAFCDCLTRIAPRLYSIASSLAAHPGEVHLTVARATARKGDREYKGVASTMFSDRLTADHPLQVFVHPSHGFTVPADPHAPMIMVGPGTGIAPFRAFLEERCVTGAPGKNWLFFGDQHAATDFLYEAEFGEMLASGKLTKLSLAFSRDQDEKIYVQNRMLEEGAELFRWLEEGGYFFVCGDAKRMAVDVDKALHQLISTHGNMSEADAKQYVENLKTAGRYVRDVY